MVRTKKGSTAKKPAARSGLKQARSEPTPEAVARRAYEKFVARGAGHGSDMQDWYEAEQELRTERIGN